MGRPTYGALRDVKLAREPPRGGSGARPARTQTRATIVAIAASTASEWRTNLEAAIAITKTKIRAVEVMPLGIAAIGIIAASANETAPSIGGRFAVFGRPGTFRLPTPRHSDDT